MIPNKIFKKNNNNISNYYIYIVQIIACTFILITLFMIKSLNKNSYLYIKNWLTFQLNDSLIAGKDLNNNKCYAFSTEEIPLLLTVKTSSPLSKGVITSNFGKRTDPITKNIETIHKGIDIGTNIGENIYSVLPGNIKLAEYFGGYGNCVIIDHGNDIQTLYAHCQKLNVSCGEFINKGQKIATVGSTGKSNGAHLHFEVKINKINLNPKMFLDNISLPEK